MNDISSIRPADFSKCHALFEKSAKVPVEFRPLGLEISQNRLVIKPSAIAWPLDGGLCESRRSAKTLRPDYSMYNMVLSRKIGLFSIEIKINYHELPLFRVKEYLRRCFKQK